MFANVNAAIIGDPLYQRAAVDGGSFAEHFANLSRFEQITLGGTEGNQVDAAIGELLSDIEFEARVCSIGTVDGTRQATDGMLVRKHGRTSGYSEGEVDDIDYDALVGMDHDDPEVVAMFENQLRIVSSGSDPIGLGGDSGSAIFHRTENQVTGLYFAGPPSGTYGIANHIQNVLTALEIELI